MNAAAVNPVSSTRQREPARATSARAMVCRGASIVLAFAFSGVIAMSLSGCMTVTPADVNRLTHSPTDRPFAAPVWPARDAEWAQAIVATAGGGGGMGVGGVEGVAGAENAPGGGVRSRQGSGVVRTIVRQSVIRDGSDLIPSVKRSEFLIADATLTEQGALLEVRPAGQAAAPAVTDATNAAPRRSVGTNAELLSASFFFASAPVATAPAPRASIDDINAIALDVEPPLADGNAGAGILAASPRGVVVYLQGLAGVAYERPVIDAIRRHGFVAVCTEFPWARWQPMRLELGTPEAVFAAGQMVAKMSDDCLAEAAYAVDGAIEHLWRTRPELRGKPVVLVGFSAGSLALPAVAARLGDRVSAAVIVGSGSNIVRITQTSELTDAGMRVQLFGKPAEGTMAGFLAGEYLRHSTLDPFHAAGSLRDKPVLQLHASGDGIVPSELGEELYEQLARPERWTFRGGHRLLFLQLESHAEDIARWVDTALTSRTRITPGTDTPGNPAMGSSTATPPPPPGKGSLLKPM
jgi:hypothetical protein